MPLKQNKNGTYTITTKADAKKAFKLMEELTAEALELEKEHGIDEMRQDAAELKKAATRFMADREIEAIEIEETGRVAKLQQAKTGIWIGTEEDMPSPKANGITPLKNLVGKKLWMALTSRRPDPEKIAEAVAEGVVDEDEISDAYYEKPSAPYVRLYDA